MTTRPLYVDQSAAAGCEITAIRCTTVNIPFEAPYRWAGGVNSGVTRVVIEVDTSSGITGLGEAPSAHHEGLIHAHVAPRLIGVNAFDLRACWERAVPPVAAMRETESIEIVRAFGGVEIALWDIRGKRLGLPLYEVLGGATRLEVPFTEYFSARPNGDARGGESSPTEIAAYCAEMVEAHNSPFFEGKVGFSNLKTDIAITREVRAAIGDDRSLRLDANMAWRLQTAREALRELERFNISSIEEPVSTLEDLAQLRRHSPIGFSSHTTDLRRAVSLGVPDALVTNIPTHGGIAGTLQFIAACGLMGKDFWFYSGDTGIATAAYLHLAAADASLTQPSQLLTRWYADDVIEGGPLQVKDGYIEVPSGPGLGVRLDPDAFRRCHRAFIDSGPIEIRRPDPTTKRYRQLPAY